MGSGYFTDKVQRRKPIAVAGYIVTALGTASIGLASNAWHVLIGRASAWLGRGIRTPVRKALLAGAVTSDTYGRAFGFERMMDTLGAIVGPATALLLCQRLDAGRDLHPRRYQRRTGGNARGFPLRGTRVR
jgi:MFS family permease